MTIWQISSSYLLERKIPAVLTIFSLALGVALISCVLTLRAESQTHFETYSGTFDAIVGAKGNPSQVVMSTLFYLDIPVGTIPFGVLSIVQEHPHVENAYPIAIGDSYREFRIIGSSPGLLNDKRNGVEFAAGRSFVRRGEVVLGSRVAAETGLKIGDSFVSTHGFDEELGHEHDVPFVVTGILRQSNSPDDVAIFTDIESVWTACGSWHIEQERHDHATHTHAADANADSEKSQSEVGALTAILVKLKPGESSKEFQADINANFAAMAVLPRDEVARLYVKEIALLRNALMIVAVLVVVVSIVSLAVNLYMSVLQRKRDIAVMRSLGAGSSDIFGVVLCESGALTTVALLAGSLTGHLAAWLLGMELANRSGVVIQAFSIQAGELTSYALVLAAALTAAVIPAMRSYRTDIALDLAEE